jgi:hypothetical protein
VEVACTLDELVTPVRELAATVAAQYIRPNRRPSRIVVVARDPSQAVAAIRERLDGTRGNAWITVDVATRSPDADVVVCAEGQETGSIRGVERLPRARVIAERGLAVSPSSLLLKPRERAQARLVEEACREYHIRPWRSAHGLGCRDLDGATARLLVAPAADLASRAGTDGPGLHERVVRRLCVNSVSVYDWLVGLPSLAGTEALRSIDALNRRALVARIQPWVGTLVKQYRMHPSISSVPRQLFYFGSALLDGRTPVDDDSRVRLHVVRSGATGEADTNAAESMYIAQRIAELAIKRGAEVLSTIMVITPYRAQEALLREHLQRALQGICAGPGVEVSTLDRCQGREADLVFISLVRPRASSFLDHPKRWNVALTRAKESMIIVGDIEAYIEEGERALRADRSARGERNASVIALALRAYARQRPSS